MAMGHVPGGLLKDRILPRARVCRKAVAAQQQPAHPRQPISGNGYDGVDEDEGGVG